MPPENKIQNKVKDGNEKTPSQLKIPAYLVNFPFSMSIDNPNNVFMKQNKEPLDKDRAFGQFMRLYNFMASNGLVYILPTAAELQDQPYVANLGVYLPHTEDQTIILSNFTSPPRQGEEKVGEPFFKLMRYKTIICPFNFEGEADLKWCGENNYIGGWGIRSSIDAFNWFEKEFNMNIVKVRQTSQEQYHVDCSVFPISNQKILLMVKNYTKAEVKEIEKITEIIPVPEDLYKEDPTNCVLFYNMLLANSPIHEYKKGSQDYIDEVKKIHFLEEVAVENGLELITFNLSEFFKAGASLSCNVMNLNYMSYKIPLM